jgi:hypothetical protein
VRKEKRSFARVQLELPASLYLFQTELSHSGTTFDLSLGGCYLPLDGELPLGEECEISLTLGEGLKTETLNLAGIIARNDKNGVGIEFTNTSPDDQLRLELALSIN